MDKKFFECIGKVIQDLRRQKGLSAWEIMRRGGVINTTLRTVEQAKMPYTFRTLENICGFLEISLPDLLKKAIELYENGGIDNENN